MFKPYKILLQKAGNEIYYQVEYYSSGWFWADYLEYNNFKSLKSAKKSAYEWEQKLKELKE